MLFNSVAQIQTIRKKIIFVLKQCEVLLQQSHVTVDKENVFQLDVAAHNAVYKSLFLYTSAADKCVLSS